MCVCVCVCTCVHMYVCMSILYRFVHKCVYTCICICVYLCNENSKMRYLNGVDTSNMGPEGQNPAWDTARSPARVALLASYHACVVERTEEGEKTWGNN